jgi:hypothetical protein
MREKGGRTFGVGDGVLAVSIAAQAARQEHVDVGARAQLLQQVRVVLPDQLRLELGIFHAAALVGASVVAVAAH